MAKRQTNILSDVDLRQFVRAGVPVATSDGAGLTFTLSTAGTAAWVLRFSHGGRRHELTLGTYPDLSLSAARKLAAAHRVAVQQGVNPAAEKRKERSRKDWTMRQLLDDYEEKVLPGLADSTQRSYSRNLKRIRSGMGALSLRDVTAPDVIAQLERHKLGWSEAFTLWCVLRGVFDHAAGKSLVTVNPCAGVKLTAIIGERPEVRKRLMLTADEIHAVMNADMRIENRLALNIMLATGVRVSELYTAQWGDVHLDEARWHIPTSKTDAAMDIPLAPAVVGWLEELRTLADKSAFVLPARLSNRLDRHDGDTHLSKDAIREAVDYWVDNHGPKIRRFTPHDLRSTMKSHMRALGVPLNVSEMCLNHKMKGVEGVYDQYNYWPERRAALELWASFLVSCRDGAEWNVTPFKKTA